MTGEAQTIETGTVKVALVGRRCQDSLNLGLDYLRGALAEARIPCTVLALNRWQELEPVCLQIVEGGYSLVGLSMADGSSTILPLGLGELLRRRGYGGHITCGGQFATLARRWLLLRYPWLDSVVRFAGEGPLVQLANRLAREQPPGDVAGLTTRAGDGPPAEVLDQTPLRTIPTRSPGDLPWLLGHRVAHVAATRGCPGRCTYCGPAVLACEEWAEGRRRGVAREDLLGAGVGGVRRRDLDHFCDELARLWHEHDVRYFYLVDEHPLPQVGPAAVDWLARLRQGLRRRGMDRWGLGGMLRSDWVTPQLLRAFARAGLVRVLLGIEFGTMAEGRRYGRRIDLTRIPNLLRSSVDAGVATFSNLMLLHPDSTPETIDAGLDFLGSLPCGDLEINQMMVYHGTRLQRRLAREGRLVGNPLRLGYTFEDPMLVGFAALFHRLRTEAFAEYSVSLRCYDAGLALALVSRLQQVERPEPLWRRYEGLAAEVRGLYVRTLRAALELARAGAGTDASNQLLGTAAEGARLLMGELEALSNEVSGEAHLPQQRQFSPMRAAAASAIRTVVLGASLAACVSSPVPGSPPPGDAAVEGPPDIRPRDSRAHCPAKQVTAQQEAVKNKVTAADSCFSGRISLYLGVPPLVHPVMGISNYFEYCPSLKMTQLLEAREAKIRKALAGVQRDCLEGVNLSFKGQAGQQHDQLKQAIDKRSSKDGISWVKLSGIRILLATDGTLLKVESQAGKAPLPEALQCVQKALAGLKFPCLGGY